MKNLTIASLFDGIGGFPYAASFFGIKPIWASEILPEAVSVTKRHFPDMLHVGDITKLSGELLPPVDIISFGSPCQDLSVANGNRAGLSGERSGLFMEAIRIIKEMRKSTNGKYPRYAIWENVPGAFSSNSRRDFRAVLEAFTDTEIPMPKSDKWAKTGMVRNDTVDLAWVVYNAADFRLAQRRKRIFALADFGGTSAGKILLVPKSLHWHPAEVGSEGQNTSDFVRYCSPTEGVGINGDLAGTLDANYHKGTGMRSGTERDVVCSKNKVYGICSFASNSMKSSNPNSGIYEADTARTLDLNCGNPSCNQGGMAVLATFNGGTAPNAGIAYSETTVPTLRAGPGSTMTPHVVILNDQGGDSLNVEQGGHAPTLRQATHGNLPIICAATTQPNAEIEENLCPTITRAAGESGNNKPYIAYGFDLQQITSKTNRSTLNDVQPSLCTAGNPHVVHPKITGTLCASASGLSRPGGMASESDLTVAYCLQGNMIERDDKNGPAGSGVNEEISFTINTADKHAVATFGSTSYSNFNETTATLKASGGSYGGGSENLVVPPPPPYVVRRLTPTECERLMGFPDDWTKYDNEGKQISDSKRYSMLGNSVAVPCVSYIMQGIVEQIETEES